MQRTILSALLLLTSAFASWAQTPPSASEINAFSPLFAAAHEGTEADIQRLVAEGADIAETDRIVAELFPEDGALLRWLSMAAERVIPVTANLLPE